jgi:hypothetical protein
MDAKAQAALSWLTSELSHVENEVLRQPYPEIKYPRILPVDTSAPDWANSVEYKTLDFSGDPESYANHGGDIPLAEIAGSKQGISVHQYALGYTYSMQDIEQAQFVAQNSRSAAINILAEKANGTRQLVEHFLDRGYFEGVSSTDQISTGLINDANVPTATTGDFLPGGTDKTIDEILAGSDPDAVANELLQLFNQAVERVRVTQTNTIFRPTHILLPPLQLGKMRTYRIPNTSETLITYLERVIGVTFEELINLQDQGEDLGSGVTDRMMVYTRDATYVKAHLPRPFMLANPVQMNGFTFRVDGMVRMGGTDLRVPKMHLYVDGV